MTPDEIDETARMLRQKTEQTGRFVRLEPVLDLVNAVVCIDHTMPGATTCGGVFHRQLDGLCIRGRKKYYIYVNGRVTSSTRRRFTIAHEIGHAVMHDADCSLFSNVPHLQDRPEFEANRFAACLLISTELLRDDVEAGLSVSRLCALYGVSLQAMKYAIKERGEWA